MNVFENFAPKYYEAGLSIIPTNGKRAFTPDWSKHNDELVDEDTFEKWMQEYKSCNIGLCLGKASGLTAFDLDYNGEGHQELTIALRKVIGFSPVEKFGEKGFTSMGRFSGVSSCKWKIPGTKTVVFEFFSTSGQVVIPPSIHPRTGKPYKWERDGILDVDRDLLPIITEEQIKKCMQICEDFFSFKKDIGSTKGRHTAIVDYAFATIEEYKSFDDLKSAMRSYDLRCHGDNSYFNDPTERGKRSAEEYLDYIAKSIVKTMTKIKKNRGEDWDIGKEVPKLDLIGEQIEVEQEDVTALTSTISESDMKSQVKEMRIYERFERFFNTCWFFKNVAVCFMTKVPYIKRKGKYTELWNELGTIKSMATDWWLFENVEPHLSRWLESKPQRLLIDVPKWDGKNRIDEMLSFVKIKNLPHDVFVRLQKDWLVGILRRIKNPEVQNRINLWEGKQGKGKDTFFMNLLRAFGRYKIELNGDAKITDIYADVAKSLVVCLPEMDQFSKMSSGALKDMVSSPGKTFRSPYARESRFWPFMYSLYSTSNVRDYLKDPTGNRRFWIFEIEDIDWKYPKFEKDYMQILSEIVHLFQSGFEAKPEDIAMMSAYVEETRTPEDVNEYIIELWDKRCAEVCKYHQVSYIGYDKAAEIVFGLQPVFGIGHRRILSLLKSEGRVVRVGHDNERRYYPCFVPNTPEAKKVDVEIKRYSQDLVRVACESHDSKH